MADRHRGAIANVLVWTGRRTFDVGRRNGHMVREHMPRQSRSCRMRFRLTLTQSGSMVSATWGTTQTDGTLHGSVTGSQLALIFANDQTISCPPVTFVDDVVPVV